MKNKYSNSKIKTIGIFDSGLGGLTILNQLKKNIPNVRFIYFGDTAHLPYGNKSQHSIRKFCNKIVNFLLSKGADMVIVACHSASSVALDDLNNTFDIPIIGVIEPSIDEALQQTQTDSIVVLGTSTTIDSHTYKKKIDTKNSTIDVHEIACPLFVPIVEEGLENSEIAQLVVKKYLHKITKLNIDTMILGCTHYPLLIKQIHSYIDYNNKNKILIIDTGVVISKYIKKHVEIDDKNISPSILYFVSDTPYRFHELASNFLHFNVGEVVQIEL